MSPHYRPVGRPAWAVRMIETRKTRGLTQPQLAGRLGRSQSVISQYETGETEPDLATFEAIAAALGISPGWLAFGNEDDRDALPGAFLEGQEQNRLFAWTFHQTARLIEDEGLHGDLTFLVAYTRKFVAAAKGRADDVEAKKLIRRAIAAERAKIREGLDKFRAQISRRDIKP